MMIDIEGIPAEAYTTTLPLNQFVPVGEHYAICHNCGLLHFKTIDVYEGENTLNEEPPTCDDCVSLQEMMSKIAQNK